VIEAEDHVAGIKAEYDWVREHYPEYDRVSQQIHMCPSDPGDRMVFRGPQGDEIVLVFDLSKVWGKGFEGLE
jgi:hypothetical protein